MNYEELSSAVGTETKAEALAKGKELLKAMKFGKWEVRCWARRISADKDAWHYELVMVGAPLRLFLGGSQGRSASHCSFYVTTSVPALSFTLGYDKEYRDPNDAVKAAIQQYKKDVSNHTKWLEEMQENFAHAN